VTGLARAMAPISVLFICTGNIFRSMTAEFALKAELGSQTDCIVRSAGLIKAPHDILPFVKDYLMDKGVDISQHQPKILTEAMLDRVDLSVAMGMEHQSRIAQDFGHQIPLFSEIAYQTVEPLRDVHEVISDWRRNEEASAAYGRSIIGYIFDGMPGFVSRMHSFLRASRVRS